MMEVYKAISAILTEMSEQGISKDSKNKAQGWKFRGIDAVYNALAPLLAKYDLIILPRIKNRTVCERQTKNGGVVFYVTVEADFDFISSKDGSKHTVTTIGEAMDSGDKATNKAMSIALKYAAFQSFFIPTDINTDDPDSNSYEIKSNDDIKWYNNFEQEKNNMIDALLNGMTNEGILNNLKEQGFAINKEVKQKIMGLKA